MAFLTRTISITGTPSVILVMSSIPASIASMIAAAAPAGGINDRCIGVRGIFCLGNGSIDGQLGAIGRGPFLTTLFRCVPATIWVP